MQEYFSEPIDILAEVRRVRHEISARFNHDPKRYIEYLMELQKDYKGRTITSPDQPPKPISFPAVSISSITESNTTTNH